MRLREQLDRNALFGEPEAEEEFRRGLGEGLRDGSAESRGNEPVEIVFGERAPEAIGRVLASLWTRRPVLLASPDWGEWSWGAVRRHAPQGVAPGSVLVRTGGSSGEPKFAVHDWSTLEAAARQLWEHLGREPLSASLELPLYHVSGWMPVLRAAVSGGRLAARPGRTFLERLPGTKTASVVPTTLFRGLRNDDKLAEWEAADRIFAGGAPFSEGLLAEARRRRLPLSPAYGLTETAAMVALQDPDEFLGGGEVEWKTFGENRFHLAADGRLLVRSPQLFRGYWGGDPVERGAWWETGDHAVPGPNGGFRPTGRIGRFVSSGGETVSLDKVEAAVRRLEGVEDAWAGAWADLEWGQRVILAVVAAEDRDWREELRGVLDPHELPALVRHVREIPRTAAGKVDPDRLFG